MPYAYTYSLLNYVVQGSFFLTATKFLIACVYVAESPASTVGSGGGNANSNRLQRDENDLQLSVLLIGLDLATVVGALMSAAALFVLLPPDLKKRDVWVNELRGERSQQRQNEQTQQGGEEDGESKPGEGEQGSNEAETAWSLRRRRTMQHVVPSRPGKLRRQGTIKGSLLYNVGVARAMDTAQRSIENHEKSTLRRQKTMAAAQQRSQARIRARLEQRKAQKTSAALPAKGESVRSPSGSARKKRTTLKSQSKPQAARKKRARSKRKRGKRNVRSKNTLEASPTPTLPPDSQQTQPAAQLN